MNLIVVISLCLTVASAQYQEITLYSQYSCTGPSFPVDTKIGALSQYNFDNQAKSIRVTGNWLLYDGTNFNGNESLMEYHFQPESSNCVDLRNVAGRVSSLRFAGYRDSYKYDSLTLYRSTFFQGPETISVKNDNVYSFTASLIITGTSSWVVYDEPNFQGHRICLNPLGNGKPRLVTDTKNIQVPHGAIKSVRKEVCNREGLIVTQDALQKGLNLTTIQFGQ